MEPVNSNVVITSTALSPSMFSQIFFVKNNVIAENEFLEGSIFSDQFCQVSTKEFHFISFQGANMQFSLRLGSDVGGQFVADKLMSIVRGLGPIRFAAVGINFGWLEGADEPAVNAIGRRLFFNRGQIPYTHFDGPDARFGAYMSKDFLGTRLKLDMQPVIALLPPAHPAHKFSFAFNFHKELGADNSADSIGELLSRWDELKQYSLTIVADCLKGGE
jgi:hypothetical protein